MIRNKKDNYDYDDYAQQLDKKALKRWARPESALSLEP